MMSEKYVLGMKIQSGFKLPMEIMVSEISIKYGKIIHLSHQIILNSFIQTSISHQINISSFSLYYYSDN